MLWLQVRLPPCLPFYFLDLGCKGLTPPTAIPFTWWNNKPNLKHEPDLSSKSHLTSYKWPYEWIPFKMVPSMSNFTFSKRKGGQIFIHLTTTARLAQLSTIHSPASPSTTPPLWMRVPCHFPKAGHVPWCLCTYTCYYFKLGESSPHFHTNPCPSHYYSITLQFWEILYSLAEILEAFSYSAFLLGLDGHPLCLTLTEYSSIISLPQWDDSLFQSWNRKLLEIEINVCVTFIPPGFIKVPNSEPMLVSHSWIMGRW